MKYIIIAGIVILAAFLAALQFIPLGIEPLTELYIENNERLPRGIFLNEAYNFSFTTHNLEYQDVEYAYAVNAYDENNTFLFEIDRGIFTLSNNETKTINVDYIFLNRSDKVKIEVVVNKNLIGEPDFKRKLWWPDPNYPYTLNVHFWTRFW